MFSILRRAWKSVKYVYKIRMRRTIYSQAQLQKLVAAADMSDDDALKYRHFRISCYVRKIPLETVFALIDYKFYNWSLWGFRPEKLRDLIVQAQTLQAVAESQGKQGLIMLQNRLPEDLQWFRQALRNTRILVQEMQ
jgi:hypothetical protein